ncbi:(2Fe-2S)-binding protein [Mycolicibacterium thermoresistibile]
MSRPDATAISACSPTVSAGQHAEIAKTLADIATVSPYFTVTTGRLPDAGWLPVRQLHTDIDLLERIVGRVQTRINAAERRVAVSTFFLGLSARLWSVGLGALAGHGVLPDLTGEQLLFHETAGQIRLHIERPTGRHGDDLEALLADMVIDGHLTPLSAALRRHGSVAEGLLRGNSVSGLLSAARVFDRTTGSHGGWQLARRLCADERLDGAVVFDGADYRRTSCCLYYRTPGGGVCGDCVFTSSPAARSRQA